MATPLVIVPEKLKYESPSNSIIIGEKQGEQLKIGEEDRFPSCYAPPMGYGIRNGLEGFSNECCMDVVQGSFCFGSPLCVNPKEGPKRMLEVPSCSMFTVPGTSRVCEENLLLKSCLKPPVVTSLFKICEISELFVSSERSLFYDDDTYNKKVHIKMMKMVEEERRTGSSNFGPNVQSLLVNKCREHNKRVHCSDKKLQAYFISKTQNSVSSEVSGLTQYSKDNKISEWPALFKPGCCSSLNPVDGVMGMDAEHHKKFQNLSFHGYLPTGDYQFCEEAFASESDEGEFNMKFAAELGSQGCVGIYSKLIEKTKRFSFLFKTRKSLRGSARSSGGYVEVKTFSTLKRKYYILCKCDAGHAASEAYRSLVRNTLGPDRAPTIEQFANSSHYRLYLKQCRENARRLACQFASSSGISLTRTSEASEWREACPPSGYYNKPEVRRTFHCTDVTFDGILAKRCRDKFGSPLEEMRNKEREEAQTSTLIGTKPETPFYVEPMMVYEQEPPAIVPTFSKKREISARSALEALLNGESEREEEEEEKALLPEEQSSDQVIAILVSPQQEEEGEVFQSIPDRPEDNGEYEREYEGTIKIPYRPIPCFDTPRVDWRTYRTELHPSVGRPHMAKEKYCHFDNVLSKISVPFYCDKGDLKSLRYSNWFRISSGVRSTKTEEFKNGRGHSLMRLNFAQGFVWIKSTREGFEHMSRLASHTLPTKVLPSEVRVTIERVEKTMYQKIMSNTCCLPTSLGFEGSKRYWNHMSETDKANYRQDPRKYLATSSYNSLFCSEPSIGGKEDGLEGENRVGGKLVTVTKTGIGKDKSGKLISNSYSDTSYSDSEEEEEEEIGGKSAYSSDSSEDVDGDERPIGANESDVYLYGNADSVRTKLFGIDKKYSSLATMGKKGHNVVRPTTNVINEEVDNIGCHCTECGSNCGRKSRYCDPNSGALYASGHVVEGIELTSVRQKTDYVEFLSNCAFTTCDALHYRECCVKAGRDFCCVCGKFGCCDHPIGAFCRNNPHVSPSCLTRSETTMINVEETMKTVHNNVREQVRACSSCTGLDRECALFTWSQLTPICFVSSDSSYTLPNCG